MLTYHSTTPQGGKQLTRTVEVRQFDVSGADPLRVVRVGTNTRRNVKALREFDRLEVVPLVGDLGVEDFDDIQLARTGQCLEHARLEAGALGVERVRRVYETALRPDALHDIRYGENVRDAFGQIQPDELAGRSPDLFADDDARTDVANERLRNFGELNAVMISNTYDIEMHRLDALDHLVKRRARVAGRCGVQVTIETHPTNRGRERRPNRHQHRQGD